MRKLLGIIVGIVAVGLFSTFGTAYAAPGGSERPWHAAGSGTATVVPAFTSGTYHATHTGQGTFDGTFVVSAFPSPCSSGPGVPSLGTNSFTAADGDQLNQVTSGFVCESAPNTFHTTATYTFTGGTGRFATVTGSGSSVSDTTFPNGFGQPGTLTFTQDGTISY
jgi:hypothetical protein